MTPRINVSPRVIHALRVKAAIEKMGKTWLLHECNHVKKLPKPYGSPK